MPVGLVAHDHRQLAVRLEADQPVDDVAAGVLELAGPLDVGLLVEAGLDLDEHQHLLAGLGGVDQGVDDRGVAGGAVERLLDRQHVRVVRGLLDEPLHRRGERVVGVVQQHVAAPQRREHVDRRGATPPPRAGCASTARTRGYFSSARSRSAMSFRPRQVERSGQPDHLVRRDAELGDQQVEDVLVDGLLDLEPHRRAEAAPQQLLLQRGQEVLGVVLLDLEVLVAGDPEGVDRRAPPCRGRAA